MIRLRLAKIALFPVGVCHLIGIAVVVLARYFFRQGVGCF